MTRRTVLRYLGAYLATAVLAVPVGWALAQREAVPPAAVDGPVSVGAVLPAAASKPVKDDAPHTFTMSGGVTGLVPGRSVVLPVLVNNPNSQSIKILTITAAASAASPTCPATGNLAITGYDASRPGASPRIVAGRGSAIVPLTVELLDAPTRNQNACKGVSFQLAYAGTAVQWES